MSQQIRVFVSYTRRDGAVTLDVLRRIHAHLSQDSHPFIHALYDQTRKYQQLRVIRALLSADVLVLLVSPGVKHSPWVRFELLLGRIRLLPLVRIRLDEVRM